MKGDPVGTSSAIRARLSKAPLFLKQLHLDRDGTCTGFDVREAKPNGRSVGRIYRDISTDAQWVAA